MIYEFGSTVCQVFEIGEVTSVKRNNDIGKRFGYKIADSKNPTCPGGDTVGGEGHYFETNETSGRQIYQSYSISYDTISESWIFNSSAIRMCLNERFKMFLREKGPWCLVVMSSLTIVSEDHRYSERANDTNKSNVWLDGVRKPECIGNSSCQGVNAFFFTDPFLSENPTGFLWNPNQPNGISNDCLVWRNNPDGSSGIDDVPNTVDNLTCFNAYMCGQPPT
ncbi:Protein CBG24172 [Caenorhabditis briggsae]|uniref:Protein CBG24172 n=1 Tax=Caenorhabditis briggsae TaxID=6238 RepID=A8WK48_CAEBR|nr:Protein CBG24172 [Caenorhabditis briggsae]CAP20841.2 Protein CBG24172 [Caenorhabditis briggsae]